MARDIIPSNFSDFLTISEAADFLGVSTATLRNWDRAGKLKPRRHPHNGYRIYLHEDLEAVLRSAELPYTGNSLRPLVDWSSEGNSEHYVLFYETDEYLTESAAEFVAAAIRADGASVVAVTPETGAALDRKLVGLGIDVAGAEAAGKYVVLDARSTLARFMNGRAIDGARFDDFVGGAIGDLMRGSARLHGFGEMASLLWMDGNHEAAIELEQRWHKLSAEHHFSILCAYPIAGFGSNSLDSEIGDICSCHSHVIPAESYALADTEEHRRYAVARLQQQGAALRAEIRHRQEIEETLIKRERELSNFFDNAIEGVHKVGADGKILWANRADYELLGYEVSEYVGRPIADFHADANVIAAILEQFRRGERLLNYSARLKCKDGTIKYVLITSNDCFDDGKFAYTCCFTRDVTQQHLAEQALVENCRRNDAFLATLSHELRNPLACIYDALDLLAGVSPDEPTRVEAQDILKRQVDQLTHLVPKLIDVARITRDKIALRREASSLKQMIENALEKCAPAIQSAEQQVTIDLPEQLPSIDVDPGRMGQVFSNLVSNASKFTPRGGAIGIEVRQQGNDVVVRIRDNGIGIACEELAHIFDMFQQANQSLEKTHSGLGIGLTLVRRLVELHGGSVNAQSEGRGKGSEFVVRLPATQSKQPPSACMA